MYDLSALLHKKLDLYNLKAIELSDDGGIMCIQNRKPGAPKYITKEEIEEIDGRLPLAFDYMRSNKLNPKKTYRCLLAMMQIWEISDNHRFFHANVGKWETWVTLEETTEGTATLSRGYLTGENRNDLPLVLEPSPFKYETKSIEAWEKVYPGFKKSFALARSLDLAPNESANFCFQQCFHPQSTLPRVTLPSRGLDV